MKRLIVALVLVASMAGTAAADLDVTFETVDEVANGYVDFWQLQVRGIREGQTEPFLLVAALGEFGDNTLADLAARCERMALLAMSRPGRYLLRITTTGGASSGRLEILSTCRLIRRR
jgi:hypothetical protein